MPHKAQHAKQAPQQAHGNRQQAATRAAPPRPAPARPAAPAAATPLAPPGAGAQPRGPRPTVALWTERTKTLPDVKFNEIRDAAKAKWPDCCAFALVAKCNRQSCPKKHERPTNFEQFLKDHGLKLSGEVS